MSTYLSSNCVLSFHGVRFFIHSLISAIGTPFHTLLLSFGLSKGFKSSQLMTKGQRLHRGVRIQPLSACCILSVRLLTFTLPFLLEDRLGCSVHDVLVFALTVLFVSLGYRHCLSFPASGLTSKHGTVGHTVSSHKHWVRPQVTNIVRAPSVTLPRLPSLAERTCAPS